MTDKQPAAQLYVQIKQDIATNALPVGVPLKQAELAERYAVSRIPIRDVLQKLKGEGWLTDCGKRGVMITPLSAVEAEDLYIIRMYLEPLILAHAIPKINNQVLGQATDLLEQIDSRDKLSVQQQGELNWQFHACLYQAANRPTLYNAIANLHQQCARYIGFHSVTLDYLDTSQQQHYQLLEAIKSKQINRAKQILKQHISDAGEILVDYLHKSMNF
jgi:DNA-binding GntR family transcriptional regulator